MVGLQRLRWCIVNVGCDMAGSCNEEVNGGWSCQFLLLLLREPERHHG